jgi:uncharacterized protein (UPF0218 family)
MLGLMEDFERTKNIKSIEAVVDGEEDLNWLAGVCISDCTHLGGI